MLCHNLNRLSRRKFTLVTSFQPVSNCNKYFSSESKDPEHSKGVINRLFGYESNFASESFKSRWLMVLPAFGTHMCLGSPFAWSIMADVITRQHGFVAPAASDWSLMAAAFPLSIVFLTQGLSGSAFGKWQIKVGARKSMALAAASFGSGLAIGSLGLYLHNLPLLYFGYGFLGGIGVGLA